MRAAREAGLAAIARVCAAAVALLAISTLAVADDRGAWEGSWNSFWRDGGALIVFEQSGARVEGRYEPGGGRIEGRVEGARLVGRWRAGGAEGTLIFAMAADGQSFAGRFESGEFWNGARAEPGAAQPFAVAETRSPRAALRAVVDAANAAVHDGNVGAMLAVAEHVHYLGAPVDLRAKRRRRQLLWQLIDISTFRIYDAPSRVEGDRAGFAIGPAGTRETVRLGFRLTDAGWALEVPDEDVLRAALDRLVRARGADTLAELEAARADSPRAAIRDFLQGAERWQTGGRARALSALDLSFLPDQLYEIEAPVLADYLRNIIDRAGWVTWQEIPDDPDRAIPYVLYRHPVGSVVVAPVGPVGGPEDGARRWRVTAETLRAAPRLFAAMQALPRPEGLSGARPLTEFFQIRRWIGARAPALLDRRGLLETWQWLALAIATCTALVAGWAAARAAARGPGWLLRSGEPALREALAERVPLPLGVAVAAVLTVRAFGWLGLSQTALETVTVGVTLVAAVATALLAYRTTDILGGYALRRAEARPGSLDEILASLTAGVLKIAVVAAGAMIVAELLGLPYEGVLAGLGVGGIALAFAARDTVSNVLGGLILMSDRPFKKGDLIETDAGWATIETVGLRSTRMRTLDDALLIIPNAQLTDKSIVNWGRRRRRKVLLAIGLTYDTPREKLDAFVEGLREVYLTQPRADKTDVYIGMKGFGPSSIDIELWGYFRVFGYAAQVDAQSALVGDIVDLARRLGVSFAFPTRVVHIAAPPDEAVPGASVAVPAPQQRTDAPELPGRK